MSRKGRETTVEERRIAVNAYCGGKSYAEVAELLGRPVTTIRSIIYRYGKLGFLSSLPRSGQPKKLNQREERTLVRKVIENPHLSAPKVNAILGDQLGKTVSTNTVRRTLYRAGFHGRVARKKPFISKKNKADRLKYAKDNIDRDQDYWDKVLYTDESKFNIFVSDGCSYVWRRAGRELEEKNLKGTVKHGGGSLMVWGCMSASGVGSLVFVEGKMDHKQYIRILDENLDASVAKLGIKDTYIFSQDNDPKHTAKNTKLFLLRKTPRQIKTPAQSPDINPIEHLWAHLERQIRKRVIKNREELKTILIEEWYKIPGDVTRNLVSSMKRRLEAVIASKGGPTRY